MTDDALPFYHPCSADTAIAQLSWDFEDQDGVKELNATFHAGLISSVEFSRAILAAWEQFQHDRLFAV